MLASAVGRGLDGINSLMPNIQPFVDLRVHGIRMPLVDELKHFRSLALEALAQVRSAYTASKQVCLDFQDSANHLKLVCRHWHTRAF